MTCRRDMEPCGCSTPEGHGRCLTDDARTALLAALDMEYRAAAVYEAVLRRFGPMPPFTHVLRSEQRHAAVLGALLEGHGVAAPPSPYDPADMALPASLWEACEAAAAGKEASAARYDRDLLPAAEGHEDVRTVFLRLRDAALHCQLPAFRHWIDLHGRGEPATGDAA